MNKDILNKPYLAEQIPYIAIGLTNYCPVQCSFCFMNAEDIKKKAINLRQKAIVNIIKYANDKKTIHLSLGGGEPIYELESIKYIIENTNAKNIEIFTSGIFGYSKENSLKTILELNEINYKRIQFGRNKIKINLCLSIDEFHKMVSEDNIINIINTFITLDKDVDNLFLVLKGIKSEKDPIPKIINHLNTHFEIDNSSKQHIIINNRYKIKIIYSELKLTDKLINDYFLKLKFEKSIENDIMKQKLLINSSPRLSISYDGKVSIHEYLVKSISFANAYENDFSEKVDFHLAYDPFIVALRKIPMYELFKLADSIKNDTTKKLLQTNNRYLIISKIYEDKFLRNRMYKKLLKILN